MRAAPRSTGPRCLAPGGGWSCPPTRSSGSGTGRSPGRERVEMWAAGGAAHLRVPAAAVLAAAPAGPGRRGGRRGRGGDGGRGAVLGGGGGRGPAGAGGHTGGR